MKIMKSIFQNSKRIVLSVLILSFILGVNSCTDDDNNLGPANEEFLGTYMDRDTKIVEAEALVDSIIFSIRGNTTYELKFFESVNSSDIVDFCDHSGTILDFGTAKASFAPSSTNDTKCEFNAVPRGTFAADFINHGDTIILTKRVTDLNAPEPYDSLFILKLLK